MSVADEQRLFLHDEYFGLTLGATVQRARIYADGASEDGRQRFQAALHQELEALTNEYKAARDEAYHLDVIDRVARNLSDGHGEVLRGGRFRLGPAQKAINLFLKCLWCAGEIPAPPHCPFDSRIIQGLGLAQPIRWTALDSRASYMKLVKAAQAIADKDSLGLAEWELREYNRVSQARQRSALSRRPSGPD